MPSFPNFYNGAPPLSSMGSVNNRNSKNSGTFITIVVTPPPTVTATVILTNFCFQV
jgi:hypothetical protein